MKNTKKYLPFIIFILLCMFIYMKFGIINVNAETLELKDNLGQQFGTSYYIDYSGSQFYDTSPSSLYYSYDPPVFNKYQLHDYTSYDWDSSFPYRYQYGFDNISPLDNFIYSYPGWSDNSYYMDFIIHFRFYYDILNEANFNPYRSIFNTYIGDSSVHDSSSGSSHGGGGVSFGEDPETGEDTSGDYDITGENQSLKLSFYGTELNLYRLSWGLTNSGNDRYYDVYARYSGSVILSHPIDFPYLYGLIDLYLPNYENWLTYGYEDPYQVLSNYFGTYPMNSAGASSYLEFSSIQISTTHQELSLVNYYDADSCLANKNCIENYQSEDFTILGFLKNIFNEIVEVGRGILNFPATLLNAIRTGIFNLLSTFFIPPEGYLLERFQYNFNLLKEQLGFLFTPFELIGEVLDKYQNLGNSNGIIEIPEIRDPFYNQVIIQNQNWNLKQIFETGSLGTIYNIYLNLVDVLIIIWLVNMFLRKFNSVFSGDGEHE